MIALDPSASMLDGLREIAAEHDIDNVRSVEARWPPADPTPFAADVALIAHVGYDIEAIGPFLDAMESAAGRLCVAMLMERQPSSIADVCWPPVHGEPRVPLPALPEFLELLRARGRDPSIQMLERAPRRFESRDELEGFLRRQLWIEPGGAADRRFRAAMDDLIESGSGWSRRPHRSAAAADRDRDVGTGRQPHDRRRAALRMAGRWSGPFDRAGWRAWLVANHATSSGVHLVSWRRGSGHTSVGYEEAVEEALCVGWIDSVAGRLDEQRGLQWFSPRRPTSGWARTNKARVERLIADGLMLPAGLAAIEEAKRNGSWTLLDDVENLVVPDDLAAALAAHPPAREHWDAFSRSRRRALLEWITQAKRPRDAGEPDRRGGRERGSRTRSRRGFDRATELFGRRADERAAARGCASWISAIGCRAAVVGSPPTRWRRPGRAPRGRLPCLTRRACLRQACPSRAEWLQVASQSSRRPRAVSPSASV